MQTMLTFGRERPCAGFLSVGRRLGSRMGLVVAAVLCMFALTPNASAIQVSATAEEGDTLQLVWTLLFTPSFQLRYQCTATSECYGCNATRGEDYVAWSGSVVFPAGYHSQTISVATLDDGIVEGDEQFDIHCDDMQVKNFRGYPHWVTPSVPITGLRTRVGHRVKIMDNDD